jgi:phospholipid/cholesterol/gamma-HCH transport system permease protein
VGRDGRARVVLRGNLDAQSTGRCWRELERRLRKAHIARLEIDARDLVLEGAIAAIFLCFLEGGGMTPGAEVSIQGLNEEQQALLRTFGAEDYRTWRPALVKRAGAVEEVGATARELWQDLREQIAFTGTVLRVLPGTLASPKRLRWSEIKHVFETSGVNALPVVALFSGLVGLVLALEAAHPLEQFGAQLFVADMIGFATVRDTGALVTAIMLAGRSSSAFAAELGTMKVNQELDALTTMGLNPVRFLVVQRIIATLLLTPMLTLYAMLAGIVGGIMVLRFLGYPPLMIYHQIAGRVHNRDLAVGLIKSLVFGLIVGAVGCLRGLQTKEGPAAVGVATTRSVVASILLIILANTLISAVLYSLKL